MADLDIASEDGGLVAGLVVSSSMPGAVAAAVDLVVQRLGLPHDVMTLWALHPSEQDGRLDDAYRNERAELGAAAHIHIEELARPRETGVVWIDRYHLIARALPAHTVRMCGLYLDGKGRIVCIVHDPVVGNQMLNHAHGLAHGSDHAWESYEVTMAARCTIRVGDRPGVARLRIPPQFIDATRTALDEAARHVSSW